MLTRLTESKVDYSKCLIYDRNTQGRAYRTSSAHYTWFSGFLLSLDETLPSETSSPRRWMGSDGHFGFWTARMHGNS